jgi:uncharacterized protein YigA (DUF484 family)
VWQSAVPDNTTRRTGEAATEERLKALEIENRRLQERLQDLRDEVARNESLLRKTQERELELLRASSLAQLLERLIHGLKSSYQLDGVTLVLPDPQHEIRHLVAGDGFLIEELREVQFVDALASVAPRLPDLERPWLGPYFNEDHELLLQGVVRAASRSFLCGATNSLTACWCSIASIPCVSIAIWPPTSWRTWASWRPSVLRTP